MPPRTARPTGSMLIDHIKHNITLANLKGVSQRGVIDDMRELKVANDYRKRLNIRSSSVYQTTGQSVRRQPAEGRAVEVAVLRSRGADPRRADARHRCRRQVRNLHHHQPAGRGGQGHPGDLLGDAGAARHLRPHLRDERRAASSAEMPADEASAGEDHARHHAARKGRHHEHRDRQRRRVATREASAPMALRQGQYARLRRCCWR